ncbi:kinesin-like protein KIN-14N isoform X1 [Magnolia sinica]|uniref:kinesin-like protein KIN-14N isoform X1 n=1 Tax=Magnolia sinica TaxID=86752 RepID=UPI0026589086|nr:kinesin-like protein KIN-14N isoform X1 [Magnolia sinica]
MQERCGWQVCIFAYGQVGFGKTYHNGYTVRSQTERATRAWEQIFQISPSLSSLGWTFTMQFQGGFLSSTPSCTKQATDLMSSTAQHRCLLAYGNQCGGPLERHSQSPNISVNCAVSELHGVSQQVECLGSGWKILKRERDLEHPIRWRSQCPTTANNACQFP